MEKCKGARVRIESMREKVHGYEFRCNEARTNNLGVVEIPLSRVSCFCDFGNKAVSEINSIFNLAQTLYEIVEEYT